VELNTVYFYTVAIVNWIPLINTDRFKHIIMDSLIYLTRRNKLKIYGFVIMPNHIHIIWENIALNGKEMPYISFMKFTGHKFLEELRKSNDLFLNNFSIPGDDRKPQFWQKNGLSKIMNNKDVLEQKLNYMHLNPLQAHWNLAPDPNEYYFSSCSFYEQEDRRFDWLTDYRDVF